MNTYRFLVLFEDAGNNFLRTHPICLVAFATGGTREENGKEHVRGDSASYRGFAGGRPSDPRVILGSPNTFSSVRSGWSLLLQHHPTFAPFVATPSWIA